MTLYEGIQNSLFYNEIIDRQFYVLLTYELQRKKMYKIAQRVIILISNFGVQYLFSLLTYGFDIICGDIQAGVKIKDVRKIMGITIVQFQNDNGFTTVVLKFFDSLHDFPRRTLVYLPYYISFPLTLIATQSKHSLSAKRFFLSEIMPELDKHSEVRIPFTFQWMFRAIGIPLETLPTTLFDPIDPESDKEETDSNDQDNSDFDIEIINDLEDKNAQQQNINENKTDQPNENEEKEKQDTLQNDKIKNKKKITFFTGKSNSIQTTESLSNKQTDLKSPKTNTEVLNNSFDQIENDQNDISFSKPSQFSTTSKIKIVSLHSVFEEYNSDNINVLTPSFLDTFFGSFSSTISLGSFIVTILHEDFTFLDKFDDNFDLFTKFVKNKNFDEIVYEFDIPELATIRNERSLPFIYHFLFYFSKSEKKLDMTPLLSDKWKNKDSQFTLISFVPQINDIDLFFMDSKLSNSNYWSSESFVYCIVKYSNEIKRTFSIFTKSKIENKAGVALLSLFRIKSKITDRFDVICDSLIAPFFEMIELVDSNDSKSLISSFVDSKSADYMFLNLLDDLWTEDAEMMVNICLKFSSQSFQLIFTATPKKYQHYLYESKSVKFSTECAIYSSSNRMIRFKDFLNKRIVDFEDIAQNMTYNLELISDDVLNEFFEFSLIHFGDISRQCRKMIYSFYNQVKKVRKNCREFNFTYSIKHATDFLKFEASRRFESFMNSEITAKSLADIIEKQKTTNTNLYEYMVAVLVTELKFIESHNDQENQKIISILIELIKREIIDLNQTNNIFSIITSFLSANSPMYNFSISFIEKSIQFLGDHTFFASQLLLNDNFKKNSPSLYSKIDSTVKTFTFQNFSDFVPEIELHPSIKKFANVAVPPQKKIKSLQPSFLNLSLIPKSFEKYIEFSDWIATILVKKYLECPTILNTLIDVVLSSAGQFDTQLVQCCIYRFFSIMNEKDFDKGNTNGYLLRRNACLLGQLIGLLTLANNNPKNLRFLKIRYLLSYALSNGKLYGVVGFISSLLMQSSSLFFPPNPFTSSILGFLASVSIIQNLKSHIKNQIETLFSFFNVTIDDFILSESDNLLPDKTKDNFDFNSDLFNLSLLFSENQMERIITFDQNFYFCFISHCLILPKLKVILPSIPAPIAATATNTPPNNKSSSQSKKRRNSSSNYSSSFSLFSNSSSYAIKEFNFQDRIRIIWDIFSLIRQFSKKLSKIIVSTVSSIVLKDLTLINDKQSILTTSKQAARKLSSSLVSQISFFDYQFIFTNYLTNISLYPDSNLNANSKLTVQQKILNELKRKVIEENSFWIHQFLSEVTYAISLSRIKEIINKTKVGNEKNLYLTNLMKYVIPNQILQLNVPPPQLSSFNFSINDKKNCEDDSKSEISEDKNLFVFDFSKNDEEDVKGDRLLDHLDQNLFDYLCLIDQACTIEVMKGHRSFKELPQNSSIHQLILEMPKIESRKSALQTFFVFLDANSFLLLLEVLVFLIRQIFGSDERKIGKNKINGHDSFDDDESFASETLDDLDQEEKITMTPNRNMPQKKLNINSEDSQKEKEESNDNEKLQTFACLLMRKFILPPLAIQELISLNILTSSLVDSLFASILDSNDCSYIYERQVEMIVSYLSFYIVENPHFKAQDFIQSFTICSFLPLFHENENCEKQYFSQKIHQNPNMIQFKFNRNILNNNYNNYNSYSINFNLMKKVMKMRKVYFEFSTSQINQFVRKIDLYDNIEYTSLFTKWKNAIRTTNEFQLVSITKSCSRMPQDFFFNVFEKESIDDILKFLRCIDKICEIKSIQKNIYMALITIISNKKKELYNKIFLIIKSLQKFQSLSNSSLPFLLHQLRPLKFGDFTFLWISLISEPRFIVSNLQNEASITTNNTSNSDAISPNDSSSSVQSVSNDNETVSENRNQTNSNTNNNEDDISIGYAPLFIDFAASVGYLVGSHDPNVFQIVYKAFLRLSLILSHDFPDFIASIAITSVALLPPGFIQLRNILLSVAPRSVLATSPLTPDIKIDHLSDVHQAAFNMMPLSLPTEVHTRLQNVIEKFESIKNITNNNISTFPTFSQSTYNNYNINNSSGWNSIYDHAFQAMGPSNKSDNSSNGHLNEAKLDIDFIIDSIEEHPPILPVIVEETFNITISIDTIASVSPSSGAVLQKTPFLSTGAVRFFVTMILNIEDDLIVRLIDCFVDQLRFRCRNTHFFSKLLIELFKMNIQTETSASVSEIIAVSILQRCALQPPHPWGLSVTVIELMSNKDIGFWEFPFTKSASSFASSVTPSASGTVPAAPQTTTTSGSNDKVSMFLKSIYYLFCNSNNNNL
ncbi:hypothetical protein M9Y10_021088 [Tritrichomonas musculus]|uniref:HECT domain-containing protein n=1 Tax=Tritrichomonas musculus TaxID=1915356 RepID=A0ABR2HCX9_9EUKA